MMVTNQIERVRYKGNQGFTLIEVIAVLIILGILGVVIVSRVSSTSVYSVKSQAEVLKSHIRYAQTMAMGTGIVWGIDISNSNKQYSLFRDNDTTHTVLLPGANSNPVVLETNEPSLSPGTVRFDGKGAPVDSSGDPITTVPAATLVVSMTGAPSETIIITKNTGFIP